MPSEAKKLNAQVEMVIDDHLRKHDPIYQSLLQPHDAATTMKRAVDTFIKKIKRALSEIDDATGVEILDLVTRSWLISLWSYLWNSKASRTIKAAQRAAKLFQQAVNKYNGFLKHYQAPQVGSEIGDGGDLVFDLVFDGFDFMSLFTLFALGDAESRLLSAQSEVAKVDKIVSDHLDRTSKAVLAYAQSARGT